MTSVQLKEVRGCGSIVVTDTVVSARTVVAGVDHRNLSGPGQRRERFAAIDNLAPQPLGAEQTGLDLERLGRFTGLDLQTHDAVGKTQDDVVERPGASVGNTDPAQTSRSEFIVDEAGSHPVLGNKPALRSSLSLARSNHAGASAVTPGTVVAGVAFRPRL